MVEAARSRRSRMNQALPKGDITVHSPRGMGTSFAIRLFRRWFRA